MLAPQTLFKDKTVLRTDSKNERKAKPEAVYISKHNVFIQIAIGRYE
jgi:hypothetical protein